MRFRLLSACALSLTALVFASRAESPPPPPVWQKARPALPAGVAPCESCHGPQGEGNPAQGVPRIAAQSEDYLVRQLAAYAEGGRKSVVMGSIAKSLGEGLRRELGAYYARLEGPQTASASAGQANELGRQLAARGDNGRNIQACANCHGPDGIGEPPGYPYLAGQHAGYLASALRAWRDGSRKTDPTGQMQAVAKNLSDQDIEALSAYYAGVLPPPSNAFATTGPARAPALASQPGQGSGAGGRPGSSSQGVGTEQGEPTTGGSQGPGGGGATSEDPRR